MRIRNTFIRFLLVGVCNTLIDTGLFNLMIILNFPLIAAGVTATTTAMVVSYMLNGLAVFEDKNIKNTRKILKFAVITATGVYVIQYSIMYGIQHALGDEISSILYRTPIIHDLSANIRNGIEINVAKAMGFTVGIAWNYLLYRKFVFTEREGNE
ncbi:MAG: GtrA family protein [Candidatus Saccharimonadales bacterium]